MGPLVCSSRISSVFPFLLAAAASGLPSSQLLNTRNTVVQRHSRKEHINGTLIGTLVRRALSGLSGVTPRGTLDGRRLPAT